jgi:hypothetical protein
MRWIVILAAISFAAPATAAPVYLRCKIDGANSDFTITLDEERGTAVTLGRPVPATFAMDEVSFEENVAGVVRIRDRINRKTLDMTTVAQVKGKEEGEPRHGRCEVVKATENKF